MRAAFPSLLRFSVLATYGLKGRGAKDEGAIKPLLGQKRNAVTFKSVAKTAGIAILVVLLVADFVVLFFGTNWAMYQALKPVGLQGLLILNAAMTASFLVFFIGFATALSTYCLSSGESLLLSLPLKPKHLLGAKIVTVYLSNFLLAFLLMATAYGVYAWGERPGPGFYVYGLLSIIALPVIPVVLSYLILVPLMSALRALRNKNAVMIVGGIVGLAFALAFNFAIQASASRLEDSAWILQHFAGPDAFLAKAGMAYLPAFIAWKASSSGLLGGALWALANLAIGAVLAALAAIVLGPAYASSLSRFGDVKIKRVKASRGFLERKFRARSLRFTLFMREVRNMNREPVYFINGPMIVLLMPVIVAIMVLAQGQSLGELKAMLAGLGEGPWLMLVAAASGAFLGSSTSITCTSISRDAKVLSYIKSLPIPIGEYALAKFLHGFSFSAFGAAVGVVFIGAFAGLPAPQWAGALFVALAVSAFIDVLGLWLDTANPRLSWDNPTAAMKQNLNAVIVILGTMALLGGLGVLAALLRLGVWDNLLAFGLLPALLAAGGLALYPRYAIKKIGSLET